MMELTKNQISIMKHTIGGPNRNWFGCDSDSSDGKDFEKLIKGGYAGKRKAASWMGEDVIYYLTKEGIKVANQP